MKLKFLIFLALLAHMLSPAFADKSNKDISFYLPEMAVRANMLAICLQYACNMLAICLGCPDMLGAGPVPGLRNFRGPRSQFFQKSF